MTRLSFDQALELAGTGAFQRRLLAIFGLVWAADAIQMLAVGFTTSSIAAGFRLTVPQALQTGTSFFLGMLIGASLFGRLADRFGRRNVLIWTVAEDAVFGLLSGFAPSFGLLLAFRLLTGIAVGGTLPVDYAMMAEFLPAKNRGRWLVALEGFWVVGTVAVAMVTWWAASAGVAEAWRWIFAATAAPAFVGYFPRMRLPESPLYVLNAGRAAEARTVVDRLFAANGRPPLGAETELVHAATPAGGSLFTPELRRRSGLILAVWCLVSLAYYGVFVWVPAKLAAEGFGFVRGVGFLVLVALAQLPSYALAAYGVEKWGLKPTLIGFLVLSAAGCLMFTFAATPATVAAALLLMSFALLGALGRALRLHARAVFHGQAGHGEGRGRHHGAAGRAARAIGAGGAVHAELRRDDRVRRGAAAGRGGRDGDDRRGGPGAGAGLSGVRRPPSAAPRIRTHARR